MEPRLVCYVKTLLSSLPVNLKSSILGRCQLVNWRLNYLYLTDGVDVDQLDGSK